MSYKRIVVKDITEYITRVLEFSHDVETIWYRGHTAHYYHLEPSAYRFLKFRRDSQKIEKESIMAARSDMLHVIETQRLELPLDWLCYLQHNRLPTRLLDWTTEFHVALYFAFEDYSKGRAQAGSLPCVWAIKPKLFVQKLIQYIQNKSKPFGIKAGRKKEIIKILGNFDEIKGTNSVASVDNDLLNDIYIPFISPFVNERAKLQGGCFIRFPLLDQETDDVFSEYKLNKFIFAKPIFSDCVAKFIFLYPSKVVRELSILNLDSSKFTPEVENIALSIKRQLFEGL